MFNQSLRLHPCMLPVLSPKNKFIYIHMNSTRTP